MPDTTFNPSRRTILTALGTIGAASVGAGLGTTAFLSDEERFESNALTAGELDLKVDWEEHYSYPQGYGFADPAASLRVQRSEPADPSTYTALPDPNNPQVWVHDEDLGAYMDNTTIESFPDDDNNRVQDDLATYDACVDFADVPEDMDPTSGLRTKNADTYTDGEPAPLVNLHDVKPGDFGELTLSFHLCDNPGYVWLQGTPVSAAEGGITEPESGSDDTGAADEQVTGDDVLQSDVELLDEIRTLLWYDEDGDNVYEPGGGAEATDVMLVFDKSESMNGYPNDSKPEKLSSAVKGGKSLVDALGGDTRAGLTVFADDTNTGVARGLGSDRTDIKADLDGLIQPNDYRPGTVVNDDDGLGNISDDDNLNFETRIGDGIEDTRTAFDSSNRKKVMVILSDGNPVPSGQRSKAKNEASLAKDAGIEIYTIAYGGGADQGLLETLASEPVDTHAFFAPDPSAIEKIFGQLGRILGGEEAFFRGSLRELLTTLSDGIGVPLDGNRDTAFNEIGGDPTSGTRECFINSTNNFIGLAWWVPDSVGNEIQSDTVSFDLGFYTEQCRHNDGSGQTTETTN